MSPPLQTQSEAKVAAGFDAKWQLVAFLWVCYALNHADRQVIYTLFPVLQKTFAFSDTTLGLTGSLFIWVYGASSPFAGVLGDRWPKSNMVASSLAIWSLLTFLCGLAPSGAFLLLCRALLGVAESLFYPSAYAMIAAAHGQKTSSRAVAVFGTSHVAGVALGGSLSGYIAEHYHWRLSFCLLGLAGMLFAIPLRRFFHRSGIHADVAAPGRDRPDAVAFFSLLRISTLRFVILFLVCSSFSLYLVTSWLPTYLGDRFYFGLARSAFGASVYPQMGSALGLFTGGFLADRYNARFAAIRGYLLVAALTGAAPCLYFLGSAESSTTALAAALCFGFFSGFGIVNQSLAAFEVVPQSRRASTVGMLNLVSSSVSGFAPMFGGIARKAIGIGSMISLAGLVNVIVAAAVLFGVTRYFRIDQTRTREQT